MKLELTKQEAERALEHYYFLRLDEQMEVSIDVPTETKTICVSYTSSMVQNLWISSVEPVQTHKEYWPLKIALIKIYRNLHQQLTGAKVDLLAAKNFVEDHTRH